MGHLYDTLKALKSSLGVRSFATRHAKQVHGWVGSRRSQTSIRNLESKTKLVAATYQKSYDLMVALDKEATEKKGLQSVGSGDLKMLSEWLEEERYSGSKSKNSPLPWFWTLMPLSVDGQQVPDDNVREWNREGKIYLLFALPLDVCRSLTSVPVVRLEWVHAKAAYDRWEEELLLLKEELRRVQLSFEKEAHIRSNRPLPLTMLNAADRPQRGYMAYSKKQGLAYERLAAAVAEERAKFNI